MSFIIARMAGIIYSMPIAITMNPIIHDNALIPDPPSTFTIRYELFKIK